MSDTGKAPSRSAAEIEADLARTRNELTDTVNLLSERLSPRTQLENVKQAARATAADLNEKAMSWADDAAGRAASFAETASGKAASFAETASLKSKGLAEEASEGDPRALAILGGVAAGAAALIAAVVFRHRR